MPFVVRTTRGRSAGEAGQLAQPVHPRPRAIDHDARADRRHLRREQVPDAHALDAVAAPHDLFDLTVVVGARAVADRGEDVLETEPLGEQQEVVRVVARAAQILGADARLERQRLDRAHHPVPIGHLAGREQVVEPHPDPHRDEPALGPGIDGDEERQRAHEVRRQALERLLLAQGLAHETPVEQFEVPQAAVDELR